MTCCSGFYRRSVAMLFDTQVDCPYCGESFETSVDCSAGGQTYIEDCPVCCQPIEMRSSVDIDGSLLGVSAARGDE
jgi:transcription elongation factor Elf1